MGRYVFESLFAVVLQMCVSVRVRSKHTKKMEETGKAEKWEAIDFMKRKKTSKKEVKKGREEHDTTHTSTYSENTERGEKDTAKFR